MDFSILAATSSSSTQPSAADRLLKAQLQAKHVKELWLLLTAIISILTLANWSVRLLNFAFQWEASSATNNPKPVLESYIPGRTGRTSIRRLPIALANAFKIIAFRWTVPIGHVAVASVTELVFIVIYTISMFVLLWVQTQDFETFLFEDRAAHLASCQLPLIVALAGKNNIISFLTGVGHEKLNVLHRASARVCLIFLWIHAMIRSAPGLPAKFALSNGWMRWGVAGLTAFTLASILSIRPIRHAAFEFFLVSHIILIAIFLVGGLLHAREPGFGSYIWPAILLWGLDRTLRLVRLIFNNGIWKSSDGKEPATVELLSSDTIRLTIRRRMHWRAGQHAYIILPSISRLPTEAHPFSIASIPYFVDGKTSNKMKEVQFLIRARSGFTKKLREFAAAEKGPRHVSAYIDGPYGNPPDLKQFSTCVLIAGGSGVSYTLPLLLDLIYTARYDNVSVQKILFVWVIRDPQHLNWITKILLPALHHAPSSLDVEYRIHVTERKSMLTNDVKNLDYADIGSLESMEKLSFDEKKSQETSIIDVIKTKKGRPNIKKLLESAVTNAVGPISVDVAGPSNLAQSVRSALSSEVTNPLAVMKGRQPVTLHIETFGMVKG